MTTSDDVTMKFCLNCKHFNWDHQEPEPWCENGHRPRWHYNKQANVYIPYRRDCKDFNGVEK